MDSPWPAWDTAARGCTGLRNAPGISVEHEPLRIWMVSASYLPYYGGITEHVWHASAALARRGHRVTIVSGRPLRPRPVIDPDPPGVRVVRTGRTLCVPSNGARACVTFGARMRRLPETAAPDVVHIQSPLEPGLPLWALRQLPGVKIGTFHTGGRTSHWGYRWFGRPLRAAARALDGSIAVSREAARYLSTHRLGTQHVIPNGVDFERFAPAHFARAARAGLAPGVFTLLYVGRCDPRKGLETLLDAIARLAADAPGGGPRVRLVVAGDGPCRAALERHARRAQLPVSFAGAVPRALLPHHYAAADAFVAPSRDGESFGISLLEAAAAGLPIVAADIDGYRETLQGSDAALFFPAGSGAALARVLRVLRGDRVRCSRMGASAQRHARRFAWDRIAGEIEAVYRDRLARRAAPRLSRWMRRRPLSVSASSTS